MPMPGSFRLRLPRVRFAPDRVILTNEPAPASLQQSIVPRTLAGHGTGADAFD